eukprot:TRINITY_DN26131_c0_g1_i1.p1 TRINITY_DN26131_c0_g1~~TRINITY_DN26131_c0_g1_i1.p1  ORF type:complete len:206 (-),score=26.70 TRINITY_DN26131_c0_g1_i1:6-602(-)
MAPKQRNANGRGRGNRGAGFDQQQQAELRSIQRKLQEQNLVMTEIPSDGHCMFKAAEHQFKLLGRPAAGHGYRDLRRATAEFMRKNPQHFLPFVLNDEGDVASPEEYKKYCDRIEKTSEWGGNVELQALAQATRTCIVVFTADGPEQRFGEQFSAARGGDTMCLTYHQHYRVHGAHYNSAHPPLEHIAGTEGDGPADS